MITTRLNICCKNGDDRNDGSIERPLRSIDRAIELFDTLPTAPPGDYVEFVYHFLTEGEYLQTKPFANKTYDSGKYKGSNCSFTRLSADPIVIESFTVKEEVEAEREVKLDWQALNLRYVYTTVRINT